MNSLKNNAIIKKILQKNFWKSAAIFFMVLFAISLFFNLFSVNISLKGKKDGSPANTSNINNEVSLKEDELISAVLPKNGVELPVVWGDLGKRLVETGVIDKNKFESLYTERGGFNKEIARLLEDEKNGKIVISEGSANVWLNLLWAFGLGNKNVILEKGSMKDPRYGGVENFASTGGWTLSKGSVVNHYSGHPLVVLNEEQQALVEKVSKNIYRPCCGNSTYFPDCNHGMAMLGLLELMASQGVSENEMYKVALQVNSFWFPQTYLTIAKYLQKQGTDWKNVDPKLVLGASFSSAEGYSRILSEVEPVKTGGGGGCGV